MTERDLIPLGEARRRLGISKVTMARLVREECFMVYANPLDRRQKLVDAEEVANAVRPRPVPRVGDRASNTAVRLRRGVS